MYHSWTLREHKNTQWREIASEICVRNSSDVSFWAVTADFHTSTTASLSSSRTLTHWIDQTTPPWDPVFLPFRPKVVKVERLSLFQRSEPLVPGLYICGVAVAADLNPTRVHWGHNESHGSKIQGQGSLTIKNAYKNHFLSMNFMVKSENIHALAIDISSVRATSKFVIQTGHMCITV